MDSKITYLIDRCNVLLLETKDDEKRDRTLTQVVSRFWSRIQINVPVLCRSN
jgi:hypothetical protein